MFDFHAASPPPFAWPPAARPVYNTSAGRVVFEDATDRLLIALNERLHLVSDQRNGTVVTTLSSTLGEDSWLASRPLFTLALLEQLKRHRRYGLHAALLVRHGRGLVLPATSGAGKSTLTVCLLRGGFDFGSDDMCFLAPAADGMRVLAFPDEVDLTADAQRFFPELRSLFDRQRCAGAPKWQLWPEEVYGTRVVQECTPSLLVFPRIADVHDSALEPMSESDALLELVANVLLTEARASQAHLDALTSLVRQSRCWRLHTGRDFDRIPGLLADLMDGMDNTSTGTNAAAARYPVCR